MNKFEKNPNPKTSYAYIVRQGLRPVRRYMWHVLMDIDAKEKGSKPNNHTTFYRFMDNWSTQWGPDGDNPGLR